MARPIDPTPRRVVPPHEKASEIAHVATSMEELTRLLTDKPPAWTLAAFISVLVQRRNALQGRLRTVSAGYQPDPWEMPISAQEYYALAHSAMVRIADFGSQTEKFLASPAFTGAVGDLGDNGSDADAVISVAHRLMDYHAVFLEQAEVILQTSTGSPSNCRSRRRNINSVPQQHISVSGCCFIARDAPRPRRVRGRV